MFNTIEVPIIFPLLGIVIFFIFGYLLYSINNQLKNFQGDKSLIENRNAKEVLQKNNKDVKIDNNNYVTAPMVGVAYFAPDPSKEPYVKVGDHIKQGDTVLLIEAMKTFNEVRSPSTGVIKKILITNGKPVEFGEKLIIIE